MYISDIFPLISAICVFLLGLFVYIKNHRSRINFTFFLHAIVITIWLFGTFMMFISRDHTDKAIFWDRFVYIGVVFIPVFMYHFGLAFINKKKDFLLYLGYALSICFLFISRTKFFVDSLFYYQWGVHSQARLFHHVFLIYFCSYVLIWFIKIINYYRSNLSPASKEQTKYVLIGFLLLFTIGPVAYLPAYKIGIYPFAYISGLIFTIIIAYAIIAHRLMDIRLALRKSFVIIFSFATITIGALGLEYLILNLMPRQTFWLRLIPILIAAPTLPMLQKYFYRVANKYFFSSLYDPATVIREMVNKLSFVLDSQLIYDQATDVIMSAMHPKAMAFFSIIKDGDTTSWKLDHNVNFSDNRMSGLNLNPELIKRYLDANLPITAEELKSLENKKYQTEAEAMNKMDIDLIIPLLLNDQLIGIMAVGPKESGEIYNDEDIATLESTGFQAVLSLNSANLYEETENYSGRLKKTIEQSTTDLELANNQLRRIEASKTDFISIASHQLRTPLTIIKGYSSMMLEGDFGPMTQEQMFMLAKAYESNERLNRLVENLLYLSRIESDRLHFRFEEKPADEMVDRTVNEFFCFLDRKEIKYGYHKPDQVAPMIKMDAEKIRQLILNLLDNALKYTKEGNIMVDLTYEKEWIKLTISDSGPGLAPDELTEVFHKFQPGAATNYSRPESVSLGLYISQHIINGHGGKLWAESEGTEKGSRFIFCLPLNA